MMKKALMVISLSLIMFAVGCSFDTNSQVSTSGTYTTTTTAPQYVIENLVLVNDAICSVTVTEVYDHSIWGFTLKILVENKTSDKEIMFSSWSVAVNGYEIGTLWTEEVTAGNRSNTEMNIGKSTLSDLGITTVEQVKIYMRAYDSNDWSADDFFDGTFIVYPTGLSSSDITPPGRPTNQNEYIVVDNAQCTFIIIRSYIDNIWGYTIEYYIENKTADKELMFSWDDVAVNGFMIDPFWATSIQPGNRKVGEITFSKSAFTDNSITSVSRVVFELQIYDANIFLADKIVEQVFQYNPVA